MEPNERATYGLLFPTAAYTADLIDTIDREFEWSGSFLNPAARINSLDLVAEPSWDIDGAEPDGHQLWAIPRFARGRPPRRIDVYIGNMDDGSTAALRLLSTGALIRSGENIGSSDLARHISRALENWSRKIEGFERLYMDMPFGSQITIEAIKADFLAMDVELVADYDMERQWLSVAALQKMWQLPKYVWPEILDLEQVQFRKQLHDSIILVDFKGRPGEMHIFKCVTFDAKGLYNELKVLLTMPPHENVMPRPLYIVTKRVRFGGKHGVCGFILRYYPLGTLNRFISLQQPSLITMGTRLRWAKELTEAFIHIRNSPAKFYSDFKLKNIAIAVSTKGLKAVVIDFDQGTPWYTWAPPEVNYASYIDRLSRGHVDLSIQEEYKAILRSLNPAWKQRDRSDRYANDTEGYSTAWLTLEDSEREAAMVYMLGKLLWCLFEGVTEIVEPASLDSFRARPSTPLFPTFNNTPALLQNCIKQCTVGSPEWSGLRQPFVICNGKIYPRGKTGTKGEPEGTALEAQESARTWWKAEVEDAKRFFRIRLNGPSNEDDRAFTAFLKERPTFQDVLHCIEEINISGGFMG